MYCEGYWKEGVCIKDMHFCGEPTSDFDEAGRCMRVYYEAHRENFWDRSKFNTHRWREGLADEFMLGLINEIRRIDEERKRQLNAYL